MTPAVPLRHRLGFVPGLDGVRGIAVLLVMASHFQAVVGRIDVTRIGWLDGLIDGGYLGVDLFFVLSGFLITTLLLTEHGQSGRIRFGKFYLRRALRLLPALYFMLLVHSFYTVATGLDTANQWASVRAAVLYLSNWQVANEIFTVATGTNHLWSLAVEEQFYLVWPLLLAGLIALGLRTRGLALSLVAAIAVIAVHRARLWEDGAYWLELFVRTDTRADSLLVGALLSVLWLAGRTETRLLPVMATVAVVFGVLYMATVGASSAVGYRGGLTAFAFAAAVVILAVVDGRWAGTRVFEWSPLQGVGRISYGLYLWHFPVFHAVARYGGDLPEVVRLGVAVVLSFAFTLLSWFCLERPLAHVRARFRPQPVETAAAS